MTSGDLQAESTRIKGLWQLKPKTISDERGIVRELFRLSAYHRSGIGMPKRWAQINLTWTLQGALRGLHGEAMTKLVGVASGEAFGAYLDARSDSETYGAVLTVPLTVGVQMLVPPGVCNGFQATSYGGCEYLYCLDREWVPGMAGVAVNPLDPALGIPWPLPPQLSEKDATAPRFLELSGRR